MATPTDGNCSACRQSAVWDKGLCADCLAKQEVAEKKEKEVAANAPIAAEMEAKLKEILPLVEKNAACPFGKNPHSSDGPGTKEMRSFVFDTHKLSRAGIKMTSENRETWSRDGYKGTAQLWRISHPLVPEGKRLYWYTWEEVMPGTSCGGGSEACWLDATAG